MKHVKLYEQFLSQKLLDLYLKDNDLTPKQLTEEYLPDGDTQSLKVKVRALAKQYLKGKGYDQGSKKYANDLVLLTYAILHILNQYK